MFNFKNFLFDNNDYEYTRNENKDNVELIGVSSFSYKYGEVIPSVSFIRKINN